MDYYEICDNCERPECVCEEIPLKCANCKAKIYTCVECGDTPSQCFNCNKRLINNIFIVKNQNNSISKVFSDKEQAYSYANRENLELILNYENRDEVLCENLDIIQDDFHGYYNFIWNNVSELINLSDDYHKMLEVVEFEIE